MKPLIPALVTTAVILAGCAAPARKAAHHAPKAPPSLSAAAGARICSDVAAWLPGAVNKDRPRFTAALEADETQARGSELGTDLTGLDSDLLTENGVALMPGPPGDAQNIQLVRSDCEGYGVTVPQG